MVETIKVDTTVDRIKSKREDRAFALKLNNHFCPMTTDVRGESKISC